MGRVVSAENGTPVVGALVTLEPGPRPTRTDREGLFNFPMPTPGHYALSILTLGLVPARDTVTFGGDGIGFSVFVVLSGYINRDRFCVVEVKQR